MAYTTQIVPLTGLGGVPPYTAIVVSDAESTFITVGGTASINGTYPNLTVTVNASAVEPGIYALHITITDSATPFANVVNFVIQVIVDDPGILSILNDNEDFQPGSFPATFAIPLEANGGIAPYVWSLIPSVTTAPSPYLTGGSTLNFTLGTYGLYTVGVNVVDAVGNSASTVLTYTSENSALFALVDGQLEVLVTVPDNKVGTHYFSATITDSSTPPNTTPKMPIYYTAFEEFTDVQVPEAFFDHYWGVGDLTKIVYPIIGLDALEGYSLGTAAVSQPVNGITVTVDNTNNVVEASGPPSLFQNSQTRVPLTILHGPTQVALITREYTFLAHSGSSDIGAVTVFPRPYIVYPSGVGDLVGLNPQKPWFNSPSIQKNATYTARVQNGSALPAGLSLDANTSLIYGNLAGISPLGSVIEYIDPQGLVHGTVTINWTLFQSQFTLINELTTASVQQPYSAIVSSNSPSNLQSVSILQGVLPGGLIATIGGGGSNITISGTPVEAGYFDIWMSVTNVNNQVAYMFIRFVSDYAPPLVILTNQLPNFTNQPYLYTLQGFGGVPPYTWALASASPAFPAGITLAPSTGILSGTYATAPASYNQNLIFQLTDSNTPPVAVTAAINLTYNNTLIITTPSLPIVVPGQQYSFSMSAQGGTPAYTWSLIGGPVLPTGISFNSSGQFTGVTSESSYSTSITVQVADTASHIATATYTLKIGTASGLIIDTSDCGPIYRGIPYNGHLSVYGPGTPPYAWQVPPSSPNVLSSLDFTLTADATTDGVTATISGTYSGAVLTGYPIEFEVTDSVGNTAFAYVLFTTSSNMYITNRSLPVGETGGAYSVQFAATGGVPSYIWSETGPALPAGFTLTSGGLLSGTTGAAYNQNITINCTDSLSPANTAYVTLNLWIQASTLAITTASPLPAVLGGLPYSVTLAATESPVYSPFVWTISPSTAQQLPPGLSLNPSTGVISGTTTSVGSGSVTIRVTDSLGSFKEKAFTLGVTSGLSLQSWISYNEGAHFWTASTAYPATITVPGGSTLVPQYVVDYNNNIQKVATPGTSGPTPPAWNTSGTTNDGSVVWQFVGPQWLGYIVNGNVANMLTQFQEAWGVVATNVQNAGSMVVTVGGVPGGATATLAYNTGGVAAWRITGAFQNGNVNGTATVGGVPGGNAMTFTLTNNGVQASVTLPWAVFPYSALRVAPQSGTFPSVING
jgi:hypothetical protein